MHGYKSQAAPLSDAMTGETIGQLIGQYVREAIDGSLADSEGLLTKIAEAGGDAAGNTIVGSPGSIMGIIKDAILVGALTNPELLGVVAGGEALENAAGRSGLVFALGYTLAYLLSPAVKPLINPVVHATNSVLPNELLDPETLAELTQKGLMTHNNAESDAAGSGINGDRFSHLTELATQRLTADQLLELRRRQEISDAQLSDQLQKLGYNQEGQREVRGLQRQLISVADLALANLRGFLSYEDALAYAKILGVDENDLNVLIANTGEPPGLEELLFAYRREFIDEARLVHGIKQSRVKDEWVDVVERLRFSPMSTADAARAVVEGYMTPEQGAKIAEQNGLEPEHWPFIHESWGRPLAHEQMMELYYRGQASLRGVRAAFKQSDIKDEYINESIELGRRMLPLYEVVSAIKYGALSTKDGAKVLLQQGFIERDVQVMLKLGLAEGGASGKALTQAQIVSGYEEHLTSRAKALSQLEKLKYSKADAEALLNLADAKAQATLQRQEQATIRAAFLSGAQTDTETLSALLKAGLDQAQADHLLAVWEREKRRASRTLTQAQILQAAERGIISVNDALAALEADGLSEANARILLKIHGVKGA